MSGYMDLFLETGNPAFYMMAKQEGGSARAAAGSAVDSASGGAVYGAVNRRDDPVKEETSLR